MKTSKSKAVAAAMMAGGALLFGGTALKCAVTPAPDYSQRAVISRQEPLIEERYPDDRSKQDELKKELREKMEVHDPGCRGMCNFEMRFEARTAAGSWSGGAEALRDAELDPACECMTQCEPGARFTAEAGKWQYLVGGVAFLLGLAGIAGSRREEDSPRKDGK